MLIGDIIRSYRFHQELTRQELSKAIGIRLETLRQIEEGTQPRPQTLQKLFTWMGENTVTVQTALTDHPPITRDSRI